MKQSYLLGIDIGTSATKLALFSREGGNRPVAVVGKSYATAQPAPHFMQQEPDDWWRAICRGIPELLEKAGVSPTDIAGIGVDGQSWAAVAVDEKGECLCPTPIWSDTRSADICRRLEGELGSDRLFSCCGNPTAPGYTFPKIIWYRENAPEVYRRARAILQSNGYAVFRLTGELCCDLSQGYGFACFDMRRGAWDTALCREAGVRPELLPRLAACHEVVGHVTPAAAREAGLVAGIPVVAGGLDCACDSLGAGIIKEGQTQEQGGQSGGMSICTATPTADKRLILCRHVVPNLFLLQGGTVGGGSLLRWFDAEFCRDVQKDAAACGKSSFALLDEEAAHIRAGSEGLVMLPYMAGERSPVWDEQAQGVFYGMDFSKTRAHFWRAAMEGAAFALRHNLEVARDTGTPITVLRASGGAANSPLWTQIKADVTGYTIEVPEAYSTAAYGAALLAGVGTGFYESFEAATRGIAITRVHTPTPSPYYEQNYRTYRSLYTSLRPLMHEKE